MNKGFFKVQFFIIFFTCRDIEFISSIRYRILKNRIEKLLYKVGFFFFEKFDYNFYYTFLNTGINIGLASSIEEY